MNLFFTRTALKRAGCKTSSYREDKVTRNRAEPFPTRKFIHPRDLASQKKSVVNTQT